MRRAICLLLLAPLSGPAFATEIVVCKNVRYDIRDCARDCTYAGHPVDRRDHGWNSCIATCRARNDKATEANKIEDECREKRRQQEAAERKRERELFEAARRSAARQQQENQASEAPAHVERDQDKKPAQERRRLREIEQARARAEADRQRRIAEDERQARAAEAERQAEEARERQQRTDQQAIELLGALGKVIVDMNASQNSAPRQGVRPSSGPLVLPGGGGRGGCGPGGCQ